MQTHLEITFPLAFIQQSRSTLQGCEYKVVSQGVIGRGKPYRAQKMKVVGIILAELPHFLDRTDLECCLRCMAFGFNTFSPLQFDLSGETTLILNFPKLIWFSYVLLQFPCEILICSRNSNVLMSTPDPQSFIRSLLIFILEKSIDRGIEENVLEWRGKGSEF